MGRTMVVRTPHDLHQLDSLLQEIHFTAPGTTWRSVRRGLRASRPASVATVAGLAVLCLLVMATMIYAFHTLLQRTLTAAP